MTTQHISQHNFDSSKCFTLILVDRSRLFFWNVTLCDLFIFKTYAPLLLISVYLVTVGLNYIIVDESSLMCDRVIFYCRFFFHHILIFLVFSEYIERGGLSLSRSDLWPYKLARGLLLDPLELRVFGLRKRSQLPKSISLNFYLVRSKTKYWKKNQKHLHKVP